MSAQIPGYYYDTDKKKYFKIEGSQTAPREAVWSAENVKRRKLLDEQAELARQRQQLISSHTKRAAVASEPCMGGELAHELGFSYSRHVADVPAAAWAGGLVEKGDIPFVPSFATPRYPNIPCFYVGGDDEKTGLGVAYATLDEETLIGSYIPMDSNDRICFSLDGSHRRERRLSHRHEMVRCPQMSSIRYHSQSHKILLTSREPDSTCGVYFFSPPMTTDDDPRPQWLLGETNHYQRISLRNNFRNEWVVNQCTPAPAESDLICTIGTNSGVLQLMGDESIQWVTPKNADWGNRPEPKEIFDQDFLVNNHNVLLTGGRQGNLFLMDLRMPHTDWESIRHRSSITHLKSINQHQVIVAGLESSMAIYDIRFRRKLPNGVAPILEFPEYQNLAHVHIGWDVNVATGLVAAAHDNGHVGLYSLRTGARVKSPVVDAVNLQTPVKSVMFQTMPRDRSPSLFMGIGPKLHKFSFGVVEEDDEG